MMTGTFIKTSTGASLTTVTRIADPSAWEALHAEWNDLLEASGTLVRHHFQRTLLRAAREHIEKRR